MPRMTQADVDAYQMRQSVRKSPDVGAGEAFDGPEDALHAKIEKELLNRRWLYFHGSMAHRTKRTAGEPDFQIFGSKGRFWLIECKSRTGKRSAAQLGVALLAEMNGHCVHVVRSYADFLKLIY